MTTDLPRQTFIKFLNLYFRDVVLVPLLLVADTGWPDVLLHVSAAGGGVCEPFRGGDRGQKFAGAGGTSVPGTEGYVPTVSCGDQEVSAYE